MVDKDRIKENTGGKADSEPEGGSSPKGRKNAGKKSSSKPSPDSGSGKEIDYSKAAESETKSDKLEKLKGASGSKGSSGSSSGGGKGIPRRDAGEVLECLGNIVLFAEGTMRSRENPDSKKEKVQGNIAEVIYDEYTTIISRHDVQAICEKYGIDWKDDVLEKILEDQDFSDKVENFGKKGNGAISVGGGKDFEKRDYHELLLAAGEMFLFTEMVQDKVEREGGRKKTMAKDMVDDMVSECIDFLGVFNVQENAEDNGISWNNDVLGNISQG